MCDIEAIKARHGVIPEDRSLESALAYGVQAVADRATLLSALSASEARAEAAEERVKALSYVHEGGVSQAREYLNDGGHNIDPIEMSDAIGVYLEIVTRNLKGAPDGR